MQEQTFAHFLQQLLELTPSQSERLHRALCIQDGSAAEQLISTQVRPKQCHHCDSFALISWGSSHGLPRFRCKDCGKTCNPLSHTPLAHLRKREQWMNYLSALIQGDSVRKSAKVCGVNSKTAFLWRHRFLAVIQTHKAQHEEGIVEADETFFLESFKGQKVLQRPARRRGGVGKTRGTSDDQIPVLIVRDRHKATSDFILERIDSEHIKQVLEPLVDKDAILCTDGASVYRPFTRQQNITHEVIYSKGPRVRGVFHIQNVNAYDSRLKNWMRRFHGVATKYLANYLGWRRLLERYAANITPGICLLEAVGHYDQQLAGT